LPLHWLQGGVRGLMNAGCSYIVIPCNSAHFWYSQLSEISVPILHIVDSVAEELKSLNLSGKNIGILGTQGTIESGLYQTRLNDQGWNCIVPSKEEMSTLVQPAINLIKSGELEQSHPMFMSVVDSLIARGAQAVVLGCTEIPLAVKEDNHNGIPLINSIDSLVKAAIKERSRP